jgi:hypothetical protein
VYQRDRSLFTTSLYKPRAPWQSAALDNIHHRYNENWACALTPWDNRLKVPIRVGKKDFPGAVHG